MSTNRKNSVKKTEKGNDYKQSKKNSSAFGFFIRENALPILVAIILIVVAFLVTFILRDQHFEIGTSIIRDINITLISTMATLLGLYVTAYIFLNDSLKNRRNEDPTLNEPIQTILADGFKQMLVFSIITIIAILAEVAYNIYLGRPIPSSTGTANPDVENATLMIGAYWEWGIFISSSIFSLIAITLIINASRKIMSSDSLIGKTIRNNLDQARSEIISIIDNLAPGTLDGASPLCDFLRQNGRDLETKIDSFCKAVKQKRYKLSDIYGELFEKTKVEKTKDNDEEDKNPTEFIVQFGKHIRLIESILEKICDNNIDKSILLKENTLDGMEAGLIWLLTKSKTHEESALDIRDQYRFLDFLKYQLMTEPEYRKKEVFDNEVFEEDFLVLRSFYLTNLPQKNQGDLITYYRGQIKEVIKSFFKGYRQLIDYRNALSHVEILETNQREEASKPEGEVKIVVSLDPRREISLSNEENKKILVYTQALIRVLIDLFTLFVKINNLNLGNSIFDKGWFNYSELSESSFTHSSFRFARLENAILRHCDLSTCNFEDADASNTDFTKSNFSYSNLTGMDLTECVLNEAAMNNIVLRDSRVDSVKGLRSLVDPKDENICEQINGWKQEGEQVGDSNDTLFDEIITKFKNNDFSDYESIAQIVRGKLSKFFENKKKTVVPAVIVDEIRKKLAEEKQEEGKPKSKSSRKVSLSVAKLDKASFNKNVVFGATDFSHVRMIEASFRDADLSGSKFYYTKAERSNFFQANMNQVDACFADFESATFAESSLIGTTFSDCKIKSCDLRKSIMLDTKIIYAPPIRLFCDMIYKKEKQNAQHLRSRCVNEESLKSVDGELSMSCDFSNCLADRIVIINANLHRSRFSGIMMRDCFLFNNILWWNSFEDSNLSNGIISGVSFFQASLARAQLSRTRVVASDFSGANLESVRFISARIEDTLFDETNLKHCNFSYAYIKSCEFISCDFEGVVLLHTVFENVIFDKISFEKVIGLEGARFKNCTFGTANGSQVGTSDLIKDRKEFTLNGPEGVNITLLLSGFRDGDKMPMYSFSLVSETPSEKADDSQEQSVAADTDID